MNRSIQVEGSFANIKQNVLVENLLLDMAHNINKIHNKIQSNRTGMHLFPIKKSA